MEYRQHHQPGCVGCLLLNGIIILVTGGAPALFNFLGFLMFAGLFFILLLLAVGWGFSYYVKSRISSYEASQTETHNRFVFLLVNILVKIAQADGHFTKAELQTMLNFFQYNLRYDQDQMYWVKQLIKEAREQPAGMNDLLQEFRETFAYEPRLILHISAYDQRTIEAKYKYRDQRGTTVGPGAEEQYYAVLGLESGADFNTVKKAYRKLSMQYHPDKVGHLGEEFQRVAEEKMKEINMAYDYFKKKFENA
jgi:DnaJ like chaperone protein